MDKILPQPRKRAFEFEADEDSSPPRHHDPLVESVMNEEQAAKRAKKAGHGAGRKGKKKGLTLEEVEKLEGGTVKESQIGMAASRRADRRKQSAAKEGTEMLAVDDLVDVEEALEHDNDEGVKLEPFNLAKEREEGDFDEGGNYVERKEEDDPTMNDAWLSSSDAAMLSDAARQKIEAQKVKMASAEAAPEITPRQTADLLRKILALLQPRETVVSALRRLRPQTKKKGKKQQNSDPVSVSEEKEGQDEQIKLDFETLTDVASTLMDAGELDIYSIPQQELQARADRHPAEEENLDMFGDDSAAPASTSGREVDATAGPSSGIRHSTAEEALADATAPAKAVARSSDVDYGSWPVKELTRFLKERGHNAAGMTEKADLVAKVKEIALQGPEGEQPAAPPGYTWDPASGFFWSSDAGMYYDAASGGYYTPSDGKWWSFDASTGQFKEFSAAA